MEGNSLYCSVCRTAAYMFSCMCKHSSITEIEQLQNNYQLLYTVNKSWSFWQKITCNQLFFWKRNLHLKNRNTYVYNVLYKIWSLLSGQVASAACLEANNDICDFQISLFFKMSKDSSSEKHFTLSNSVKVRIQLQCFDLQWEKEKNTFIAKIASYHNADYMTLTAIRYPFSPTITQSGQPTLLTPAKALSQLEDLELSQAWHETEAI